MGPAWKTGQDTVAQDDGAQDTGAQEQICGAALGELQAAVVVRITSTGSAALHGVVPQRRSVDAAGGGRGGGGGDGGGGGGGGGRWPVAVAGEDRDKARFRVANIAARQVSTDRERETYHMRMIRPVASRHVASMKARCSGGWRK